jgi:hypothetical protein
VTDHPTPPPPSGEEQKKSLTDEQWDAMVAKLRERFGDRKDK